MTRKSITILTLSLFSLFILSGCFGRNAENTETQSGIEVVNEDGTNNSNTGTNQGNQQVFESDLSEETIATKYFAATEADVKAKLLGNKRVAVFFFAENCKTCQDMDQEFQNNLDKLDVDVAVAKLDFANEINFRREFGITTPSSVVTFAANGELLEVLASPTLEQILVSLSPEEIDL